MAKLSWIIPTFCVILGSGGLLFMGIQAESQIDIRNEILTKKTQGAGLNHRPERTQFSVTI
jgi:hypothetical protein